MREGVRGREGEREREKERRRERERESHRGTVHIPVKRGRRMTAFVYSYIARYQCTTFCVSYIYV